MNALTEIHMLKLAMKVINDKKHGAVNNNKCVQKISKVEKQGCPFNTEPLDLLKIRDIADDLDKKINEDYKKMIAYLAAIQRQS